MKKIFYGMLFVFFNFTINFGDSIIGLIPDFIGYILMMIGCNELKETSGCFVKVKPVLIGMTILSVIFYILDFLGLGTINSAVLLLLINGIAVFGSLYSTYMITCGVVDMEKIQHLELAADKLMYKWKVKAMFMILGYLVIFIPIASLICMLVSFIFSIIYLFDFNHSKNCYEQAKRLV